MNLPSNVWYVKVFRVALFLWASFRFGEDYTRDGFEARHANRTNLCFFVRTILVWGPLALAAQIFAYGAALSALTVAPIYLFGGGTIGRLLLYVAGAGLLTTGLVAIVSWVDRKAKERAKTRPKKLEVLADESQSAWSVFVEWLAAHKAKVCPTITFTGAEQ